MIMQQQIHLTRMVRMKFFRNDPIIIMIMVVNGNHSMMMMMITTNRKKTKILVYSKKQKKLQHRTNERTTVTFLNLDIVMANILIYI